MIIELQQHKRERDPNKFHGMNERIPKIKCNRKDNISFEQTQTLYVIFAV